MFNLFDILNFSCFYIYNYIITPPYYIAKHFYNKYVDDYEINYIEEYTGNILNQLNFKYEKVEDSFETINYGFILSNHRSFFDFDYLYLHYHLYLKQFFLFLHNLMIFCCYYFFIVLLLLGCSILTLLYD